jgi:hypothetical protein
VRYVPCGDGTGPWWAKEGNCRHGEWRRGHHWRRSSGSETTFESTELTKEEQRKILQAELIEIDAEKRKIEKKLKELEPSESKNEN